MTETSKELDCKAQTPISTLSSISLLDSPGCNDSKLQNISNFEFKNKDSKKDIDSHDTAIDKPTTNEPAVLNSLRFIAALVLISLFEFILRVFSAKFKQDKAIDKLGDEVTKQEDSQLNVTSSEKESGEMVTSIVALDENMVIIMPPGSSPHDISATKLVNGLTLTPEELINLELP